MSVYVGIDVHRKRSQVAVVAEDGTVELNKNVVNGSEPMLRLIGDLPSGTPVASGAAFGWVWLVELLEDYGFDPHLVHPLRCKAIASARLKNDKVDAAILAQLLRADLLPEAWIAPREVRQLRALLRHRASLVRLGTQMRNRIHAVAAGHGHDRSASYRAGPGRGWLAELDLPAASREIITDCLAVTGRPGPADRPDRRRAACPCQGRPQDQGTADAARGRGVHRAGDGGRDRRHHPLRQRPQAGLPGRADPDRARLGPEGPARAHPGQGSAWLRWVMNQAAQTAKRSPEFAASYAAIAQRRGKKIATIAIARKLLTRAWHLLTDLQAADANAPLRRP
jgi:transposase